MVRKILFGIFVWLIVTGFLFGLSLWLNADETIVLLIVTSFVSLLLLLFAFTGLFKPKKYPIKNRSTSLLIMSFTILIFISSFFITIANYSVEEVIENHHDPLAITGFEKIEVYNQLLSAEPITEIEYEHYRKVGHITFNYNDNSKSRDAIDEVLDSLEKNKGLFIDLFGKEQEEPVQVVLIDHAANLQDSVKDGHISGQYLAEKQAIYLPLPKSNSEMKRFKKSFVHEYTHHLTITLIKDAGLSLSDFPIWFIEGIAAFAERKDMGISSKDIEHTEHINFDQLETNKQWHSYLQSPYNPYLQSRILVNHLIENEGSAVIQNLIVSKKDLTFHRSFEQLTGKSLGDYESEVLHTLHDLPSKIIQVRRLLYQENSPEKALKTVMGMNEFVPNVREVNRLLSMIYLELGEYDKAIDSSKRSAELFPNSSYYRSLAEVLLFKDVDESIKAAEQSVELADKEQVDWYKRFLDKLSSAKEKLENDHSFTGYVELLNSKELTLTNKQKVDLVNELLGRHPEVTKKREVLHSYKKHLQ